MKLPNDLIKATDYSNAKDREIHEFEYRNGKYIHKYVLGGEHELTPQEVVDCLNAISTIDCDLQTAYAFIQGQKDKINSLENNIIDDETLNMLVKEHKLYKDLAAKLAESEKEIKVIDEDRQFKAEMWTRFADKCKDLTKQLAEKEKENELMAKTLKMTKFIEKEVTQEKISFAVEQLEKAKETFTWGKDNGYLTPKNAVNIIDNQIKQLKEIENGR